MCVRINDVYGTFIKMYHYACLSIYPSVELNVKVLLQSHPQHKPSLHVYPHSFRHRHIIPVIGRGLGHVTNFEILCPVFITFERTDLSTCSLVYK